MFHALPFPIKAERSRNKERLEASLAGLCELELLKQRQECLVLGALCLGDWVPRGRPSAWGELRSNATDGGAHDDRDTGAPPGLQCTPWGIMASLEQQVADVRVNPETKSAESTANLEDSRLVTGEGRPTALHSLSAPSRSPEGISEGSAETTAGRPCPSEPKKRGSGQVEYDFEGALEDGEPTEEDYQQAQRVETYMMGLINRRALPQRPPKPSPRTSLAHDARAVTVARQGSLCRKEELASPGPGPEALAPPQPDPERYAGLGEDPQVSPGYHHHHLHQLQATTQLQPGHYPRPRQPSGAGAPRCAPLPPPHDSNSNSEPDSPPPHFHHGYPASNPPPPHARPSCSHGDEQQMVNAEYVPAQPCRASTRASAHHNHHHHLPSASFPAHRGSAAGPKPSRGTYSPERGAGATQHPEQLQHGRASRGGPRKCRAAEDRAGGGGGGGGGGASATSAAVVTRKQGKKACRSQSENSLQRAAPPERKYNTAEREGGGSGSGGGGGGGGRSGQPRSKKPQQQPGSVIVSGSHRRWRSTLELSQDEAEQQLPPPAAAPSAGQREHCGRRARKTRPPAPSAFAPPHLGHAHHHGEYQADPRGDAYGLPGQGESESSTSEADSPESSTLSSDSDESGGGLVWPQQLPPQLSAVLPSPPATHGVGGAGGGAAPPLQPKAFVKIKASHALKKKILRFRTGSLKVMTTV